MDLIDKKMKFYLEFGFFPPPEGTDLVGYETFLRVIRQYNILNIDGDIVEIGAFLGGGTYKLAKYLSKQGSSKKVYVVDIFDISFDKTENINGIRMADIYQHIISNVGKWENSQLKIFQKVTRSCKNIVVIKGDSKSVDLPTKHICFGFVDGNHEPSYVQNDFYLVWSRLSPGGICAFDDYGYDLPLVTKTIDELIEKHKPDIERVWVDGKVIFIQKNNSDKIRHFTTS